MNAKVFETTIDALLSAKPFQPFTIELRGSELEIGDPQALRREGVSIFTDRDAVSHYFDHESVLQIFESPAYVARQNNKSVTPIIDSSTDVAPTPTILETFGTVRADGTLELDQKLTIPPGRVKVRVEPAGIHPGWPPGFSDLFGSVDDETFIVHPQPPIQPAVEFE